MKQLKLMKTLLVAVCLLLGTSAWASSKTTVAGVEGNTTPWILGLLLISHCQETAHTILNLQRLMLLVVIAVGLSSWEKVIGRQIFGILGWSVVRLT